MSVAVLIPWRGGDPYRERARDWVMSRYRDEFPEWELHLCEAPEGPWSKAAAINPVLADLDAGIVVVSDADCWCDDLERAVYAVVCGSAWAQPHLKVHRLGGKATAALLADEAWDHLPLTQRAYDGVWGGGIVVGRSDVLLDAPLDPSFIGWGQEDTSWALALSTLHGPGWRGDADLIHLFHPPEPRLDRQRGSKESWKRYRRYRTARNDPVAMRALLDEAREEAPWALTG